MELLEIVLTLGMLVLLQAVLGFDNLLYISLESQRAPEAQQSSVRKWGIGIAVGLRVVLHKCKHDLALRQFVLLH